MAYLFFEAKILLNLPLLGGLYSIYEKYLFK